MYRFFTPDITESNILPEEESQHAVRVLRLVEGDYIEAVDGRGDCYKCRIVSAHPKKCVIEPEECIHVAPHWSGSITIGIAPTKNLDRMEWMAEKVTEMGVDKIIPLRCRYSERKELKTERLRKILVSAMKQSLKCTLPELVEMTPVTDVLKMPFAGQKFIAYCDKKTDRKQFSLIYRKNEDVLILIGPEGDFSKEEVDLAIENGFMPVSFGESRLRTETAAMYAVAACHALKQV